VKYEDKLELAGKVKDIKKTDFETESGEEYYRVTLEVPRFSENYDEVPLIIPGKFLAHEKLSNGTLLNVSGSVRTRNYENNGKHMSVFAFVDDLKVINQKEYDDKEFYNRVYLKATVCKDTAIRYTNSGRIITDIIAAFNKTYRGKQKESYYIPCIAWGANAKAATKLRPGDDISIVGRFQSRKYRRRNDDFDDIHIAYEVSILDYGLLKSSHHKTGMKKG